MTRDFNNQRREDPQSDSRGSSSRRFEEERPSRPARPRLNRDMVDRAWENGARQNHADYRTRSDSNSHPPRDNRRPNQQTNRYSAQTSSNGRKPYGNRQDNYRPGERSPRSNNGPRPRTYESSMRTFDDQHYNQYERRGYSKQPYQDDYRPGNSGNPQRPNSRTQNQGRDQYREPQRREFDRDTRQPRSYDRDKRSSRNASGPDTHNPRWQSRPERRQNNYSNRSHEYTRYGAEQELFEGDYEHFDKSNSAQPHGHQTRDDTYALQRSEERNGTHLPDGRVLKGTPDEQHRDAEFWTEIAQESDELVKQVESSHTQEATTKHPADFRTAASTKRKPNPRTHTASDSTREKKTTKARVRKSTPKPRSTGPKPSRRGYKWPTPEE
ncbi:MAG TPA: hypothetical protein VIX20_10945 [Ktedonobacteraceae bacterium]